MDERYQLAYDLFVLSSLLEDDEHFGDYAPIVEQAIRVVCPDFYERFEKELEEDDEDPELDELVKASQNSAETQAAIRDMDKVNRGEMTLDEFRALHGYRAPVPDGVIDFRKKKEEHDAR